MKTQRITWKWINLILVLALLGSYQLISAGRAAADERARLQNQIDILTVERDDALAIAAVQREAAELEAARGPYADGGWQGTAEGFGGPVTVEITVENGNMEDIRIVKAEFEDQAYMDMALAMLPKILEAQDPEVDIVSGATLTSLGIRNAVAAALQAGE